jgi:hypothetical protein
MNESININEVLLDSEYKQAEYLEKINKIKKAIEVLEEENIALPEAVYGTLAFYQAEYDKENKAYKQLIKLTNYGNV